VSTEVQQELQRLGVVENTVEGRLSVVGALSEGQRAAGEPADEHTRSRPAMNGFGMVTAVASQPTRSPPRSGTTCGIWVVRCSGHSVTLMLRVGRAKGFGVFSIGKDIRHRLRDKSAPK